MSSLRIALCSVALASLVGLAACGSDDDGIGATTTAAATTEAPTTAAPATAAATTAAATTAAATTTAAPTTAESTTTAAATTTTAAKAPSSTPGSTPDDGALTLENTTWTLSELSPLGVELNSIDVTARFVDGTVSGLAGCNQYTGRYTVDGDSLAIDPNVAATLMACPTAQMVVETAYLKALPTVASYTIANGQLVLSDASGKVVLVYDHISGEQVLEGQWDITAVRTTDAVSSPVPDSAPTMTLQAGQVSGTTGCNNFTGTYEVSGDEITFGPMATTRKACTDAAISQQETDILAAIAATKRFSGTRLMVSLLAEDGTITLVLSHA